MVLPLLSQATATELASSTPLKVSAARGVPLAALTIDGIPKPEPSVSIVPPAMILVVVVVHGRFPVARVWQLRSGLVSSGTRREWAGHSMHPIFRFAPEVDPQSTLKLKVEIDTREHESLFGVRSYPFVIESDWYQGKTEIASVEPEEFFGTKLCALLQWRKSCDLFDLDEGLKEQALDTDKLVASFEHHLALEGKPITRAVAEQRMLEKLARSLTEDIAPLLPAGVRFNDDDAIDAFGRVWSELVVRLKGDAAPRPGIWVGSDPPQFL